MKTSQLALALSLALCGLVVVDARVGDKVGGDERKLVDLDAELNDALSNSITGENIVQAFSGQSGNSLVNNENGSILPNSLARIVVAYKNEAGKSKAMGMANMVIKEFQKVQAITMTIPRNMIEALGADPDVA
jgi:hypothetical protein